MLLTHEHQELERTTVKLIDDHINPYIDEWEKAEIYPAHEVMKKFGEAGLLGIGKPEEYGGLNLDFSYEMVFAEALGNIRGNGVSTLHRRANDHVHAGAGGPWQRRIEA